MDVCMDEEGPPSAEEHLEVADSSGLPAPQEGPAQPPASDEFSHGSEAQPFNDNNNRILGNGEKPSILRPCSMMLMSITEEDYQSEYWPKLQTAITQLLQMKPGEYIPISYEQMYSCVYKCVCKQFTERLYRDLLDHVTSHLLAVNRELHAVSSQSKLYIELFGMTVTQYSQALSGIVPIFNYMNRFYVERVLRTDLRVELQKVFIGTVADRHVPIILPLLAECLNHPFQVKPPVIAELAKSLHQLKPEYAQLHPHLFARYIPNVLPPFAESDLEAYIEEVKQMQRDLRTHPSFSGGDQSRKRSGDEESMAFAIPKS